MDKLVEIFLIILYSACFGSFLNVLIYRIPSRINLFYPGSTCPKCGTRLKWLDNIPIISFLLLKGKCRHCGEKISIRYLLVELLTVGINLVAYLMYGMTSTFIFGAMCMMVYICIIFVDYKHYIIPDIFNVIIGVISILAFFVNLTETMDYKIGYELFNIQSKIYGLIIALVICTLFILFSKYFKKPLIGGGDLKLILASSLFLGYECLLMGIFIGSIIACLVEIPLSFNKRIRRGHILPFGPYLSYGFMISFLFGSNLINLYLNLIGG